jgi:hypothetical protein
VTEAEITDRAVGAIRAAIALLRNGHTGPAIAVLEGAERDCRIEGAFKAPPGVAGGVSGEGR